MMIGYSNNVDTFFAGDPSARRNFNFIPLDAMPPEEAQELLIKGFKKNWC